MDELELIRSFRRSDATPNPVARVAARDRLVAHIAEDRRALRVWLLGVLRLEVDGVEVAVPSSRRARLLLAMLAVEHRSHSREALAARLWPGVLEESARASLRTALTQLRAALGPDASRFLRATREQVTLAGPEEVWTDIGELERLLGEGRVQAALELWGGEVLTELEDDWVYERRDALRRRLCRALDVAADEAEAGGDLQTALCLTRRHVAFDPLADEPHRELIRRLVRAGDRPAALAAYEKLSRRLHEQLKTTPAAATRELAATVRGGDDTQTFSRVLPGLADEDSSETPSPRTPDTDHPAPWRA